MNLQQIKNSLGDYAKDIKLNLSSVLTEEGAPDLSIKQIQGIALASAYATRNAELAAAMEVESTALSPAEVQAAKSAATIMAMNNIYYRFTHMAEDKEYAKMPARLRMNVIGAPGIEKLDFELTSLAVSAINGCGMCMEAHVLEVTRAGSSRQAVQSAIRIAAVVNALAQGVMIGALGQGSAEKQAAA